MINIKSTTVYFEKSGNVSLMSITEAVRGIFVFLAKSFNPSIVCFDKSTPCTLYPFCARNTPFLPVPIPRSSTSLGVGFISKSALTISIGSKILSSVKVKLGISYI